MELSDYWVIVAASTWFLGLAIGGALVFGLFVFRERGIQDQMTMLVQDRNSLQLQLDKIDLELASRANELETATQDQSSLRACLRARERELIHKCDQFDALLKTVDELESTLETNGRDILSKAADLKAAAAASNSLRTTLSGRDQELAAAQGDLGRIQEELETVRNVKGGLEQEVREHAGELEALRGEMARWMAERNSEVGSLRGEMYRLQAEREAAASRAAGLQNELEVTKQALDDTNEKFNGLIAQLADVAREREQFRGRVLELEAAASARKLATASQSPLSSNPVQSSTARPTLFSSTSTSHGVIVPAPRPDTASVLPDQTPAPQPWADADSLPPPNPARPPGRSQAQSLSQSRSRLTEATPYEKGKSKGSKDEFAAACPQRLEDIKGIGPTFAQRLYEAGIGSYWQLAQMSDEEVGDILNLDSLQADRVDLEEIRSEAMRLATETNSAGRTWTGQSPDDFTPIEGLGKTYAKRLYEAGICTYKALADTTPDDLDAICQPPSFRKPDYVVWIESAKDLAGSKPRPGKRKSRRKASNTFDIALQ